MRTRHGRSRVPALPLLAALLLARCASAPRPSPLVTDGTYALRDPRLGASAALTARDERLLAEGMSELRAGDVGGARRDFARGEERSAAEAPFRLGAVYADLLSGSEEAARPALDALLQATPDWTAALEARADLASRHDASREALDGYRKALRTLPGDARLRQRVADLTERLAAPLLAEATAALDRRDAEAARRAGFALVEVDHADPRGYRVLAEAAAAAGLWDDAYTLAEAARSLAPGDTAWVERTAEIASRSGRHADAAELYEGLASASPEAAGKSESERLAFRLQNLPENARRAALSPKVTRAQAAALAYWLVPEVREAHVSPGIGVATDVVDRSDRTEVVRAIALGLLTVSDTHRVHPDAALSRTELATFLRRLATLVAHGRKLPECLSPEAAPAALTECGILSESSGRGTVGGEAVGAVERAVRAGREGALR